MPSKAKIAKSIADMAVELSSKVGTPAIRRADVPFKDVTKRIPELTEGAKKLGAGEISAADYSKLVSQHKPVDPYEFVPEPASVDDAIRALTRTSRERPGLPSKESYFGIPSKTLKEGDPVGIRLDIPSYEKEGTWIATIHGPQKGKNVYAGAGPRIGYEPFAAATDVSFMVQPKGALSIAQGSPKGTIATMEGKWKPLQADSVHKTASDYMKDPEWVQVGMDPTRHSYFYDRKTMQPVVGADEVIQVGPLVLARKPRYGNPKDFPFKGGGPVHKQDGGIMDAIEAAKASGKSGKPIALTPSPEWERDKYDLAKRLMATSREVDRLGGSVPISGEQSDEYVPKRRYDEVSVYEPTLKDRFKGVVEGGLRAVGSPRPRAESLANIAGEAAEFLPTPILAETAGRSFGQNLRKGNYGSAALDLIDPALYTIPLAPAAGRVVVKGAKALAPKLGETAEQYMMRTGMALPIFIGEKSPMWNAGAAGKAVELEKAGVDPVDIWKQTGTFRSPDGALRQEISDVGSKFRGEKEMKDLAASMKQQEADIKQKIKDSKAHPDLFPKQLKTAQGELRQQAKDIKARRTMESGPQYGVHVGNRAEFALEHPELYKAYPLLSGMDVQQGGRYGSARAGYSRGINEKDPGMVNIYDRGLANDPRSSMIHETQHAIQDIEGWGRGGNTVTAFNNPEAHKILKGLRKEASTPLSFEDWYENNFKNSASYHLFDGKDINKAKKLYEDYAKSVPMLAKKFDREYQEQAAQLYYDRLAGEAEARAAQARIDLTPKQRLENFPLEVGKYGYDVKPEDIIVKRNKKGGPVSLDAMRLAVGGMATGGMRRLISEGIESAVKAGKAAKKVEKEYKTPDKFERAPAKTVEEIEAIARRMAPQYLGEFVRKPKSTASVAGKSMKQYKREKDLPIVYSGDRPTPEVFDIAKHEGEMMVGVPGDPTIAHRTLEQIGDIKPETPVRLYGGPLYGLEGEFWASGRGPATGLQAVAQRGSEAYGGVPVLGKYIRMPEGTPYALHTTDALLQFQRPDMLGKKKLEQLNSEIRRGNLKYKFPEFVGFEDPDLVLLQAQDNPNLRKHIDNVLLKPTTAEKYGFRLSGPDIDAAITEAELRNLETGATGFSVGRLYPRANLTESAHPTYELDIPGRMIGQTKYPQPYELSFPDTLKFARENLKPKVGEFGMFKMSGPRQIIDAQLVDEIKMYEDAMKRLTGKKKGGSVKLVAGGAVKEMAEGGQITSDDLILEERAL